MLVPLAMESGEICTGRVILQPISLKSDKLLDHDFLHASDGIPCENAAPDIEPAGQRVRVMPRSAIER